MSDISRRNLLRAGAAGLFAGCASPMVSPLRAMSKLTQPRRPFAGGNERVITIFLRGAMDGVYSVVPHGDPTYQGKREDLSDPTKSIYVPPSETNPLLGTTFCELHQNLIRLGGNPFDPLTPDNRGHAAWMHQVGNPDGARSHFTEQQIYETADVQPQVSLNEEGFVPRLQIQAGFAGVPPAASVSGKLQRMYRSTQPGGIVAHVKSIANYTIGTDALADRQRTAINTHLTQSPTKPIEAYLDLTGEFVEASEAAIQGLAGYMHLPVKFPVNQTEAQSAGLVPYGPGYSLMQQCEEALQLILNTGCAFAGVEFGGWDTHNDQKARRLSTDTWLAHAIRSLYECTVAHPSLEVHILVVTEFGRTDCANVNFGTDHGVGGLMKCFSRQVNGGVYNCHGGTGLGAPWQNLGDPPTDPKYNNAQEVATDFRTVYAELLQKRFGMTDADLDVIIPGWIALKNSGLPQYQFLDFIN